MTDWNVKECLGQRTVEGIILQQPKRYATGAPYNAVANPHPTTCDLGDGWFYVLPVGTGRVSEGRRAALEKEALAQSTSPATVKVKAKGSTE